MAEYIEREAIIAEAKQNKAVCSCIADIVDIREIVENIPTADVEPVKHGRNISCMNPVDGFLCSECRIKIEGYYKVVYDEDAEDYNHYEYEMKYCPNCGAKITGGEDNADKRSN